MPFQGVRAVVLIALSLVLFFCDRNLNYFTVLRVNSLPFITAPLQRVTALPVYLFHIFSDNLLSKQALLKENNHLRSELLLAHVQLQKLDSLEQENSELSVLLNLTKQPKTKFLAAKLLAFNVGGLDQQITVDKGKADGLYVGQPVIDGYGLVGQVVLVGPKTSKVLLITDNKSAVPVMIARNGIRLIAIGAEHGKNLELVNTPGTIDIKKGDFLVTSGMGQRFPAGYAVGRIKSIKHVLGDRFMKILITPSAHVNSSRHVLLISADSIARLKK